MQTSVTYNASFNEVWSLLLAEVGLNYPVIVVEKASSLITTDFVMLPGGYANMHMAKWVQPPAAFSRPGTASSSPTHPRPPHGHHPHHLEAFENNMSKSWVACQTNGSIERQVFDRRARGLRIPTT